MCGARSQCTLISVSIPWYYKNKAKKSSGKQGGGKKANRDRGYEANWKRELFVPFELTRSKRNSNGFW